MKEDKENKEDKEAIKFDYEGETKRILSYLRESQSFQMIELLAPETIFSRVKETIYLNLEVYHGTTGLSSLSDRVMKLVADYSYTLFLLNLRKVFNLQEADITKTMEDYIRKGEDGREDKV